MDPLLITLFLFLFLLSAFFSGSEIALMSLPSHKIDSLIKQNRFWAKALKYIKDRNDKLLITILIWNNLVNVYTAALATQISISIAEKSNLEQSLAIWISTWIVTFLLLMFWEIVPKTFATKNAEFISLIVAKPYKFLLQILYPLVIIIEWVIKLIIWWKWSSLNVTDEEIESFIDMWKDAWALWAWEHEKLKNLLEFGDITAEEIMTPRVKIDRISINFTVDEAIDFILSHTHSRIPVFIDNVDNIEFIVNLRWLLLEKKKWNGNTSLSKFTNLDKAIKIPLNHPIDKLLEIFRKSRKHIAVVIDDYGWVAWLVTLEDIIEEVFWDIKDEWDREIDEIVKLADNKYVIESSVLVDVILDKFNLSFKDIWLDEKEYDWVTTSYFITAQLERFPNPGEIIKKQIISNDGDSECWELIFKVIDISDWRIKGVEVEYIKKELED